MPCALLETAETAYTFASARLEEGVADSLDVPFLPLCPPSPHSSFVEQPLMGYAGSCVLADALGAKRVVACFQPHLYSRTRHLARRRPGGRLAGV